MKTDAAILGCSAARESLLPACVPANSLASRSRILVFSSEPHVHHTINFYLEVDDYDVQFASLAADAPGELRRFAPDLVLVDACTSGAGAVTLCHRIRADAGTTPPIPILVLTSRDAVEVRQQIMELGAADFLPSPVDAVELRTRLRALLSIRHARSASVPDLTTAAPPSFESLGAVALGLGHDLNNILQSVFTASQLLQEVVTDEAGGVLIHSIRSSAARGAALVADMLAYARGRSVERGPARLQPVVDDAAQAASLTFPKNIQFQLHFEPGLWEVNASTTQIYGVLINLLANARDVLPDGGKIHLETANVRLDPDQVAGLRLRPGRHVVLRVSDNGSGIVESLRERVFEPFFTTKAARYGTGIGLSQARQIVRDHGGDIRLTSEVGLGSVFEVFLPCEPGESFPATPTTGPVLFPLYRSTSPPPSEAGARA